MHMFNIFVMNPLDWWLMNLGMDHNMNYMSRKI